MTTLDLDAYVYEALLAGSSGFALKDIQPEQLVDATHVIANGEALLSPMVVTRRPIEEFVRRPPDLVCPPPREVEQLTPREAEILRLVARGVSNAEIAAPGIRERTNRQDLLRTVKLGSRDRVQVVVYV